MVPCDLEALRRWVSLSTRVAPSRSLSMPFDVVYSASQTRAEIWVEGLVDLCGMHPEMYVLERLMSCLP